MIDLETVRAETPGCDKIIHFNNAGCALSPHPVTDSVISHLQLEQRIGGYEAASQAEKQIANFYTQLAQLLNCESSEIAFMESATRAAIRTAVPRSKSRRRNHNRWQRVRR